MKEQSLDASWLKRREIKPRGITPCQRFCYGLGQACSTVSYTRTSGERPAGDVRIVWEFTHTADSGLVDSAKGVPNIYKVE